MMDIRKSIPTPEMALLASAVLGILECHLRESLELANENEKPFIEYTADYLCKQGDLLNECVNS